MRKLQQSRHAATWLSALRRTTLVALTSTSLTIIVSTPARAVESPQADAADVVIEGGYYIAREIDSILASASPNTTIRLGPGLFRGPLHLEQSVKIQGVRGTVIAGSHQGHVVEILSANVVLENVEVRGSGQDLTAADACIYVASSAANVKIFDSTLHDCLFGIWVHESNGTLILGNRIWGSNTGIRSMRGNGIQLFNASHLAVVGNEIFDGRDGIYVSATEDSLIAHNTIVRAGYGVHYMYSWNNELRENTVMHSVSGYAIMASRDIRVVGNQAFNNQEHGILLREIQHSVVRENWTKGNEHGLFVYLVNQCEVLNNRCEKNTVGAKVWAGSNDNLVAGTRFVGNTDQIFYVGTADMIWGRPEGGNYWSDYVGWDQDGDGIGDRPYRVNSFSTILMHRYPAVALLASSPSLEFLSHMEARMPLLQTPTLLDNWPLISPRDATFDAQREGDSWKN